MLLNNLLPASYRNVKFFVEDETVIFGGLVKQENSTFSLNSYRTLTPTSNKPSEANLTIYFTGAQSSFEAKKFKKFSETNEVGNLQLPVLGIIKNMAIAEVMEATASNKEVGIIKLTVKFVEVVDKKVVKNLFTDLQDLIAEVDNIIAEIYDNLYIFKEVSTALYTVKAGINKLLTSINIPNLLLKDLQSGLEVKKFLDNTIKELKKQPLSILSSTLGFKPIINAKNNINAVKVLPLNIINQTFSVATTIAFAEATTESSYLSKNDVNTQIKEFLALNDSLTKNDCLNCLNNELFVLTSSIIQISLEILKDKQLDLPEEYDVDLDARGGLPSVLVSYYSNTNLDYIEKQQFKIYNMQGKIKCLKF